MKRKGIILSNDTAFRLISKNIVLVIPVCQVVFTEVIVIAFIYGVYTKNFKFNIYIYIYIYYLEYFQLDIFVFTSNISNDPVYKN
jgi:hypothetical protein